MSARYIPDDPGGLRLALNWFHTWFGLSWGGCSSSFSGPVRWRCSTVEIDRWMMPATRLPAGQAVSADSLLPIVRAHAADARGWRMMLPDDRTPVIEIEIALPDGGAPTFPSIQRRAA